MNLLLHRQPKNHPFLKRQLEDISTYDASPNPLKSKGWHLAFKFDLQLLKKEALKLKQFIHKHTHNEQDLGKLVSENQSAFRKLKEIQLTTNQNKILLQQYFQLEEEKSQQKNYPRTKSSAVFKKRATNCQKPIRMRISKSFKSF